MASGKRLTDQLCQVITSFLCPSINVADVERCAVGPHIFSRGSTQAICTVKLIHGQIYNLEFVYKYWVHILESYKYPSSPMFIICNNGLACTLKCYICEPRDFSSQYSQTLPISSDVNLQRNSSVVLCQEDFLKFKTPLVFAKDLDIIHSMVVCRTYLTNSRQSLQFLVVKSRNPRRLCSVLEMIEKTIERCGLSADTTQLMRRPLRSSEAFSTPEAKESSLNSVNTTNPRGLVERYKLPWSTSRVFCALLIGILLLGMLVIFLFVMRMR